VDSVDGVGPAAGTKNVKLSYVYDTEAEFNADSANIPVGARVVKLWELPAINPGWVDVPFTLGTGWTVPEGAYLRIKYNAALRAYRISISGMQKTNIQIGEYILTLTNPPAPIAYSLSDTMNLGLYSSGFNIVGRAPIGLELRTNGSVQIWPQFSNQSTGTVANTNPGRLYGTFIFYEE
jgi:hypothetical protein